MKTLQELTSYNFDNWLESATIEKEDGKYLLLTDYENCIDVDMDSQTLDFHPDNTHEVILNFKQTQKVFEKVQNKIDRDNDIKEYNDMTLEEKEAIDKEEDLFRSNHTNL